MSQEEGFTSLTRGISKVKQAQALLESARADIGACAICDQETKVLAKATGDLGTILETAMVTMEKKRSLEGLKELGPLSKNLESVANEARSYSSSPSSSPAQEEMRLLPIPRPTEMLKKMGSSNQRPGILPPMPHELFQYRGEFTPTPPFVVKESKSGISRPPMPHEVLGLPLPGKLFREMTGVE